MKKSERVLRELLIGVIKRKEKFSQKELAKKCKVSIGLVNQIIKKLEQIGVVQIFPKGLRIIDPNKLLFHWAAHRSIKKELEGFYIPKSPEEIEKTLPNCVIFTAFSGWKLLTGRTPADYREVIVYVPKKDRAVIEAWLKEKKPRRGLENFFVVYTEDIHLIKNSHKNIAPLPQIFVDLYSLASISSKYFIKDILEKYPGFKL